MKTIKYWGFLFLAIAVFASCNKVTYRKTKGGMPYQLFKGKDSQKVKAGDIVKYHVIYKVNDSLIFSSFDKIPTYMPVGREIPYDISEVWSKLNVGDSVVATQMMDTFIKRSPGAVPPRFKKGDRIITIVKVLAVLRSDSAMIADEQNESKMYMAKEISLLEKYLAEKNIKTERTPSGAFVQITNPGTGNLVDSGNYISVNYTGTTMAGKKFDSNTDSAFKHVAPYSFTAGAGRMIKGFDEGVQLMRLGGSARVYIPSMLAYGSSPDPSSGIMPFENLVFDITIVDIKDKEPPTVPLRKQHNIKVDAAQPKN